MVTEAVDQISEQHGAVPARSVLADVYAALFVPCDDIEALTAGLQMLCNAPELRSELQVAASARARCYSLDAAAQKYSALYDAILGRMASAITQREARA